jgi:hypothetical protein
VLLESPTIFRSVVRHSEYRNRGPNRTLAQYAQQFQQYRQLLDQAFLGTPGQFEPAAINRYVQQVRTQLAWAKETVASAAAAPNVHDSFVRIQQQAQSVNGQLSLLSASEKS